MKKKFEPKEELAKLFDRYVKDKHGNSPFPAFKTTRKFFQCFFETNLDINDFANLSSTYLKKESNNGKYEFVKKDGVNYYKLRGK